MKIQFFSMLCLLNLAHTHKLDLSYTKYYLITRNTILRNVLSTSKYKNTKFLINRTSNFSKIVYNKLLSTYYEATGIYYSLSDEDITILENVLDLCY